MGGGDREPCLRVLAAWKAGRRTVLETTPPIAGLGLRRARGHPPEDTARQC